MRGFVYHADEDDLEEIEEIFEFHRDVFPHIRDHIIEQRIEENRVILEDGVVIIYNRYSRSQNLGSYTAGKGDFSINQIANKNPGNGKAGEVLENFFEYCLKVTGKNQFFDIQTQVWLKVRKENERAIQFYKKYDFESLDEVSWKDGEIKGLVMRRKLNEQEYES